MTILQLPNWLLGFISLIGTVWFCLLYWETSRNK